ncbi:MAG: glycosyltransferase [Burkholderiales bacterium]
MRSFDHKGKQLKPLVLVLLATYNGKPWLEEQLDSILQQCAVNFKVVVSDDLSSDGTWEWLRQFSEKDSRVTLLPHTGKYGCAARNFFRLLRDVDLSHFDYVCFADQDDIWDLGKLRQSINMICAENVDAFSSDVMAFWPDGRERLISKAQPMREWDHFFESPGPGCTFMMKAEVARKIADFLRKNQKAVEGVALHDWFVYAWVRSNGYKWWIDPLPTVRYRQHNSNEFGANAGMRAIAWRWGKLLKGWYRDQVLLTARLLGQSDAWPIRRLARLNLFDRFVLVASVGKFRRLWHHRLVLAAALLLMRRNNEN